jgi:hypothetical protein
MDTRALAYMNQDDYRNARELVGLVTKENGNNTWEMNIAHAEIYVSLAFQK